MNNDGKPANVIGYHAALVQNNAYHIILEYADKGNLRDYMKDQDPPSEGNDIILVWERLVELNFGLHLIHNTPSDDSREGKRDLGFVHSSDQFH